MEETKGDTTLPSALTVLTDASEGLIIVTGRGFQDVRTSERFLLELKASIAARRRIGLVRVLVDGRSFSAQSALVVDRIQVETGRLYRDGDRVAVVVAPTLFKLQAQRSVADGYRRLFTSVEEAKAWLAEP